MSDELARRFHDIYERLAPEFGYETRPETRVFDPESPNGKLMIAVCAALSTQPAVPVDFHPGELERMNERGRKAWAGVDLVDGHIAEPSPVVPGGLIECLRGGRQCDESGEEIIMSRQACCEAADILERIAAPPAPAVKLPLSEGQIEELSARYRTGRRGKFTGDRTITRVFFSESGLKWLIRAVEAHGIGSIQPADGPSHLSACAGGDVGAPSQYGSPEMQALILNNLAQPVQPAEQGDAADAALILENTQIIRDVARYLDGHSWDATAKKLHIAAVAIERAILASKPEGQ